MRLLRLPIPKRRPRNKQTKKQKHQTLPKKPLEGPIYMSDHNRKGFHLTCKRCGQPFENYELRGTRIYCKTCSQKQRKEQAAKSSRNHYIKKRQMLELSALAWIADQKIRQEQRCFDKVLEAQL